MKKKGKIKLWILHSLVLTVRKSNVKFGTHKCQVLCLILLYKCLLTSQLYSVLSGLKIKKN